MVAMSSSGMSRYQCSTRARRFFSSNARRASPHPSNFRQESIRSARATCYVAEEAGDYWVAAMLLNSIRTLPAEFKPGLDRRQFWGLFPDR